MRGDLIENVNKLAAEKKFDYLLIESTGISEPMPVATTFVAEHDGQQMLGKVARLDTLVTVVDARNFLNDSWSTLGICFTFYGLGDNTQDPFFLSCFSSTLTQDYGTGELLNARPALGAEATDQRTIAQLLADQVECANLIVLNKLDLVEPKEAARLEDILRKMNPKAKIIRSKFSKVDPKLLLNTKSFDIHEAEQMPGWFQKLQGNHVPETIEYGISSFVFRADKPFHPRHTKPQECRDKGQASRDHR